jgi:hypothetical protein
MYRMWVLSFWFLGKWPISYTEYSNTGYHALFFGPILIRPGRRISFDAIQQLLPECEVICYSLPIRGSHRQASRHTETSFVTQMNDKRILELVREWIPSKMQKKRQSTRLKMVSLMSMTRAQALSADFNLKHSACLTRYVQYYSMCGLVRLSSYINDFLFTFIYITVKDTNHLAASTATLQFYCRQCLLISKWETLRPYQTDTCWGTCATHGMGRVNPVVSSLLGMGANARKTMFAGTNTFFYL